MYSGQRRERERIRSVLVKLQDLRAIARGEISLVFRRWKRPTVKSGGTMRTPVGVLAIDRVDEVCEEKISDDDARRAGCDSRQTLLAQLARYREGRLYRIELRLAGPDPREKLRGEVDLTEKELSKITGRLVRFDKASPLGPWTREALRLISEKPGTRAVDLAAEAGFETKWFKTKVRKLKELGLTESLEVGYRLSPRGLTYLAGRSRDEPT